MIGQNIKKRRKELNITQKELAKRIGKAEITVRQYESGKIEPPLGVTFKIAQILDIDVNELTRNISTEKIIKDVVKRSIDRAMKSPVESAIANLLYQPEIMDYIGFEAGYNFEEEDEIIDAVRLVLKIKAEEIKKKR